MHRAFGLQRVPRDEDFFDERAIEPEHLEAIVRAIRNVDEVIVRDNDDNLRPSKGDFFSIKLSSATAVTSQLDPLTVFYARAGFIGGGNITVK